MTSQGDRTSLVMLQNIQNDTNDLKLLGGCDVTLENIELGHTPTQPYRPGIEQPHFPGDFFCTGMHTSCFFVPFPGPEAILRFPVSGDGAPAVDEPRKTTSAG